MPTLTGTPWGIIEGDYMKEMKDMEFIELLEWASENEDEIIDEQWDEYERLVKKLAPEPFRKMTFTELELFYAKYAGDNLDPWWDAWDKSICDSYPFSTILERIETIERSISVILKEHENEPAKITIGQLNRLKRGL